jgi:hypothetical protein
MATPRRALLLLVAATAVTMATAQTLGTLTLTPPTLSENGQRITVS